MPGPNYFNSITDFWRVFSGYDSKASQVCKEFLETIINTKTYELTQVMNTTASETAKIMENSYRALNIAFIDEWSKFAEIVKIDLLNTSKEITKPSKNLLEFAADQYNDPKYQLGKHEWPALKRMLDKNNSIYDQ